MSCTWGMPPVAEICLQDLTFNYPGADVETLSALNLTIANGSAHALLGASGAGKTTLLNLLSGLLRPTGGRVLFDGEDVSRVSARERNVALVFQFPVLYESKTVLQNLMFPLLNRGWSAKAADARAREIAAELEISAALDGRPAGLSLFQKQLAAIAKSLVRTDVDLVLLDEPLTAVEPAIKWRLRQTLTRFQRAHQLTMVYVTHDQTEALTFADKVSVMAGGGILQTGSPQEIYENPVDPFVAGFVGAPSMKLAPCRVESGLVHIDGLVCEPTDAQAGHYLLGLRAEWLKPGLDPSGPWRIEGVRLLGTRGGYARLLLSVSAGDKQLVAEASGDFSPGQRVTLNAAKYVLFREEDA